MTDDATFLAAIAAAPLDSTPKLVYADKLQEQGRDDEAFAIRWQVAKAAVCKTPADDAPRLAAAELCEAWGQPFRAEFIRVQCELAKLLTPEGKCPKCGDYGGPCNTCEFSPIEDLRRRQRELLSGNEGTWLGGSDALLFECIPFGRRKWQPEFSRGFVSSVTCAADDWLAHADALAWCWGPCGRCGRCGGKGRIDVTRHGFTICPSCDGDRGREPPTTACLGCEGIGYFTFNPGCDTEYTEDCRPCKGTGRVPRECPAKAQPIERVWLTTRPLMDTPTMGWGETIFIYPGLGEIHLRDDRAEDWNLLDEERKLFETRWPGITFELPPPRRVNEVVERLVLGAETDYRYGAGG